MRRLYPSVVVVMLLVAGAIYIHSSVRSPSEAPASPQITRHAGKELTELPEVAEPVSQATADSPPPAPAWLTAPKDGVSPAPVAPTAQGPDRRQEMAAAVAQLQQLQSTGTADPLKVASAIEKLEKANGSPVFHGTRLDVLRKNLELSQKMRMLTEEISELTKTAAQAGKPANPEQQALIKAKQDQLEQLTRLIQTDVTVGNSPSSAP